MSTEAGSSKYSQISSSSFDSYHADIQNAALKATKLAVALPTDISFNRTIDNDFAQALDLCSGRALKLTNSLLELAGTNVASASRAKGKKKLVDQEDVVDSFGSLVVDVLDQLFERADMSLDEYLGRTKPIAIPVKPSPVTTNATSNGRHGRLDPSILHASHLRKPQLKFRRKVNNSNDSRWSPLLKHKYNAQVPLGYNLHDSMDSSDDFDNSQSPHPYLYEIKHITYPQHMFEQKEAVPPSSFDETPLTWVDTKDRLDSLLDKLRNACEIAVDLEHHSYRTFSGFLCLMQISTREEDFIVDTLALREELEELNEVFTDPKIVKVFHGAESDIVWLQQDFNIYIVNLFDTYHASKLLDFPKHGLGALLEMYCDFVPDKRYQLADWRIRPLPTEMLKYARSDTHFLLYIYNSLRNALLDRASGQSDLIRAVLDRSQETALRIYENEVYDLESGNGPGGWNTLAMKWGRALSGTPRAVFRAVHAWRDNVARMEDESTRYVLPNHYLFQLAERPPADMAALLGVFRPVPPIVRTKAASLLEAIRDAVKEAMVNRGEKKELDAPEQLETSGAISTLQIKQLDEASVRSKNASMSSEKDFADLWTRRSQVLAAPSSALLSSISKGAKSRTANCSSAKSALFPSGWNPNSENASIPAALTRYQEVLSRIYSALDVTPSMPMLSVEALVTDDVPSSSTSAGAETHSIETEQIEIPFIPAAQRQTHAGSVKSENADTIVVVGQARQKKRKRSKKQAGSDDAEDLTAKKAKGKAVDSVDEDDEPKVEEFDYASAPNFLDGPVKNGSNMLKPQKGKVSKGRRAFEYGNFPAPPRAFNEVKGANKSHTFKG